MREYTAAEIAAQQDKVRLGIAAYRREQALILRVIRKHRHRLTERDFDRIFTDIKRRRGPDGRVLTTRANRNRFRALTGDTFILGGMSPRYRSFMLDLTQHMVALGLVKTSTNEHGQVVYA
jgi:hypothetical protein